MPKEFGLDRCGLLLLRPLPALNWSRACSTLGTRNPNDAKPAGLASTAGVTREVFVCQERSASIVVAFAVLQWQPLLRFPLVFSHVKKGLRA